MGFHGGRAPNTDGLRSDSSPNVGRFYLLHVAFFRSLLVMENEKIIVQFIPDFKDVLRAIVEARNQFTHFSPKNRHRAVSGEAILYYVDVLRLIVDLAVLREVGVPPEILQKAAMESEVYRRKFVSKPK